jgi:hypothetical protein
MTDRETLRAKTTELLIRIRVATSVPQEVVDLLECFAARLDRIELGAFESQEETPTNPDHRSGQMPAVKPPATERLGERTKEIFDRAKKDGE